MFGNTFLSNQIFSKACVVSIQIFLSAKLCTNNSQFILILFKFAILMH